MTEVKVITFPRKVTIVKDRVGCVRSSVRALPETNHVYGYKPPSDPEGAGESIQLRLINKFHPLIIDYSYLQVGDLASFDGQRGRQECGNLEHSCNS